MGTNYYVKQKAKYNPMDTHRTCFGCHDENRPRMLRNGWLWQDTYYATVENLNDDYERTIHIGKNSYGWKFLLCSYPELRLETLDDWKAFWNSPGIRIINEYDEELTSNELYDIILKNHSDKDLLSRTSPESQIVASHDTYEMTTFTEFS